MATAKKAGPVYIYGLHDPATGELRYVGKANAPAARLKGHLRSARAGKLQSPLYSWVRKLQERGAEPVMRVMLETTAEGWAQDERRLIAENKGPRLLNLAPGGEEPFCSPEVRARHAERLNAMTRDPVFVANRAVLIGIGRTVGELRRYGKTEKADELAAKQVRLSKLASEQPELAFYRFMQTPALVRTIPALRRAQEMLACPV